MSIVALVWNEMKVQQWPFISPHPSLGTQVALFSWLRSLLKVLEYQKSLPQRGVLRATAQPAGLEDMLHRLDEMGNILQGCNKMKLFPVPACKHSIGN